MNYHNFGYTQIFLLSDQVFSLSNIVIYEQISANNHIP